MDENEPRLLTRNGLLQVGYGYPSLRTPPFSLESIIYHCNTTPLRPRNTTGTRHNDTDYSNPPTLHDLSYPCHCQWADPVYWSLANSKSL